MDLKRPINQSKNAVVIDLDQAQVEDIVERKLNHFLEQRPLGRDILKKFYEPAERALIEMALQRLKGNQLRTAKFLGINRNTLKKKIKMYNLNIKELLIGRKERGYPQSRVFLGSASSLDLLSACRAKLAEASRRGKLPKAWALRAALYPVERKIIQKVLEFCGGNRIRTAQFLGINRNTLKKKLSLTDRVRVG